MSIDPEDLKRDFEEAYSVDTVLGAGSYGCVRAGKRRRDGLAVAIKELKASDEFGEALHEVLILEQLADENIIQLLDVWHVDGHPRLIFPFAGSSLREALKADFAWGPEQCCRVVVQISSGLSHLHQRSVIHNDLKPANILVELPSLRIPVSYTHLTLPTIYSV